MFSLFEENWTARDELNLVEATEELGFGNWEEICKKVFTKTGDQCKKHYMKYYINGESFLPKFKVNREKCWRRPLKLKSNEFRPSPTDVNNVDNVLSSIGYMAPRADFLIEYDNFAECDLKDTEVEQCGSEHEDNELNTRLNLTVADIYYRRLQERDLRKKVLRDYGLLDVAAMKVLVCKNGWEERNLRDKLCKFMRLLHPNEYEKLVQSILHQKQLECRIQQLKEYRKAGLCSFKNVKFYEKFKKQRKLLKPKTRLVDEALLYKENPIACQVWLQRQLNRNKLTPAMPVMPPINRKQSTPLDLNGVPQYDQLTEAEKKLCSSVRILPDLYLEYRNKLQKESFHSNRGVKLQTARDILKIDVNKTKQLYDFCLDQGFIVGDV